MTKDPIIKMKYAGYEFKCRKSFASFIPSIFGVEYKFNALRFISTSDCRILDIGGNVGIFALRCCRELPGSKIISYEPEKENAKLFRSNIKRNGLEGNVTLYQAAVFTENGTTELTVSKLNRGAHTIINNVDGETSKQTVDMIDAAGLPVCDYFKIDAEGVEFPVLERYFRNVCRPIMIAYEWHSIMDRDRLERLMLNQKDCHYQMAGGVIWCNSFGTVLWVDSKRTNYCGI